MLYALLGAVAAYGVSAYLVLPLGWRGYERRHPQLANAPRVTQTASGIPGDPLNLCLVGTREEVVRAMLAAGWVPADPITLSSALRIAADTVLRRPYLDAPVSDLFLWGRKQDLAFEQAAGGDPRRRHHVRFWSAAAPEDPGTPLWLGAATFDLRVGLSHTTGQITHHVAADIDAERDKLLADVTHSGGVAEVTWIDGFQGRTEGRNGGGDYWHTDGRLPVGVLASALAGGH